MVSCGVGPRGALAVGFLSLTMPRGKDPALTSPAIHDVTLLAMDGD